jgi:uncharacterized protein
MTLKNKHIPQRTCVACRQIKNQRELIHLVLDHNGNVKVDISQKMSGRGAYLCPKMNCWEIGINKNRLESSLRIKLGSDNRQALIDFSNKLPKE